MFQPNPAASAADKVARTAILQLLEEEHAVVWLELEAKLAERPVPNYPKGLNPHVLSRARSQLIKTGTIESISGVARGGRVIDVIALTDRDRNKTAFEKAAARKRLLQTRYLGWATTTARKPNMIGEAGERVARASLRATTSGAYMPHPSGSQVTTLFGQPIPGGPLDDVAYMTTLDNDRPMALTLAIEVKNIRHWIYPNSDELFQLLDKCALLQLANPNEHIMPVLVCRRAHITAFSMAKDIGFAIVPTIVQAILPRAEVAPEDLQEVCDELGYNIVRTDGPLEKIVDEFGKSLPKIAARTVFRWRAYGSALASEFHILRDPALPQRKRSVEMEKLRSVAKSLPEIIGGW
jgi:hypothetical protein